VAIGAILLVIVWIAWWLWAVNWTRAWERLAEGAWVPLILVMIVAALVWSQIVPAASFNFWIQLVGVSVLVCLALFCGWLQGVMHWTPTEMSLEPPPPAHGHEAVEHH
jgi:hypothetical protein